MVRKNKVGFFRNATETQVLSLYDDDLRVLFGLPAKLGKILEVVLDGQCVRVSFECKRSKWKRITIKEVK